MLGSTKFFGPLNSDMAEIDRIRTHLGSGNDVELAEQYGVHPR